MLYDELPKAPPDRALPTEQRLAAEGHAPFEAWGRNEGRVPY